MNHVRNYTQKLCPKTTVTFCLLHQLRRVWYHNQCFVAFYFCSKLCLSAEVGLCARCITRMAECRQGCYAHHLAVIQELALVNSRMLVAMTEAR